MPKPIRIIHPPQVVEALIDVMTVRLPLHLQHTRITPREAMQVLAYASVNHTSVEASCAHLAGAPSGNRLREVLLPALPAPAVLQRQLNAALRAQVPRAMLRGTRDYEIAVDITQIPYHGQPQTDPAEVMRGKAKAGTTHFHGYVTVSLVHTRRRYVLALLFVRLHDRMADLVKRALDVVNRLKIRLRRVLLDAGFCAVEVFRALDRRGLSYIVPLKLRGRSGGVRTLFHGRASYQTGYTLHSPQHGAYTVQAVVARRYAHGRYRRRGARWFAFAVAGLPLQGTAAGHAVFEWYRRRFGIEASYRLMNQVRARTTSRDPVFRLLLVGLALLLVNLYTQLRVGLTERPARRHAWLSLRRLASLIAHAIEAALGIAPVFQRHVVPFS